MRIEISGAMSAMKAPGSSNIKGAPGRENFIVIESFEFAHKRKIQAMTRFSYLHSNIETAK
jgi:hypothetical protein